MNEKLSDFYYDKSHPLWTGQEAIEQLISHFETEGKTPKAAKTYVRKILTRQAIFQIHLPPPKQVIHPHYQVDIPNKLGIIDVVTMPPDKLYGNVYKHMLAYIDVASRFAVVKPLRNKSAKETTGAMIDVLKFVNPEEIYADAGTEFKGSFKKLLEERGIEFKTEITKYHHGFTGPVDIFIRNITKRLFKRMDTLELRNSKEVSTVWVKFRQQEVDYYNNRVKTKIGISPAKASNNPGQNMWQ